MGSFSVWHLIVLFLYVALIVVPFWRIVSKAGYPGIWAFLAIIPVINLVALWIFAFAKWPNAKLDSHLLS